MEMFVGGLLILLARLINVSMGTVRTLLGMRGQKRLATAIGFFESLRAISQGDGEEIASALRQAGYGVTEMVGEGLAGRVRIVTIVVKRRDIPTIMALVSEVDEAAFVTVDDANRVYRGHLGPA